jgi:hypothetical protein
MVDAVAAVLQQVNHEIAAVTEALSKPNAKLLGDVPLLAELLKALNEKKHMLIQRDKALTQLCSDCVKALAAGAPAPSPGPGP